MKIIITENQLNRIILSEQTSITLSPPLAGRNKINSPYGDRVHPITKKIIVLDVLLVHTYTMKFMINQKVGPPLTQFRI